MLHKQSRFPSVSPHKCGFDPCEVILPATSERNHRVYWSNECHKAARELRTSSKEEVKYVARTGYVEVIGGSTRAHPAANRKGIVYEHVRIAYDYYGEGPHNCEYCGVEIQWLFGIRRYRELGIYKVTVHHVNFDTTDNHIDNLKLTCSGCNSKRLSKGMSFKEKQQKAAKTTQAIHCKCSECGREFDNGYKYIGHKSYGNCPNGTMIKLDTTGPSSFP